VPQKQKNPARKSRNPLKRMKFFIKQRLGWLGRPKIIIYRGYGNHGTVTIRGSVIEDKGLTLPSPKDSLWKNIISMLKRYSGDYFPHIQVILDFQGKILTTETDEYGNFLFEFVPSDHIDKKNIWHNVTITIADEVFESFEAISVKGEFFIPAQASKIAVISDIDDTFLVSHSTNMLRKIRLMLLKNAATRKPFQGITRVYTAFHQSNTYTFKIPFFYVSSSEWNLYDLLDDFCHFQNFPKGVFLLQEKKYSLRELLQSGGGSHQHKFKKIETLLNTYPEMKFILFGDSGQRDPEIYSDILEKYPDRIQCIYIRALKGKKRYQQLLKKSFSIQKHYGIDMLIFKNHEEIEKHAIENGFISHELNLKNEAI
jgi:phosphatidate phosphatase APP1